MSKQTEALTNKISGKPENKLPETFTGKKSGEIQLLLDKYKGAIAQVIPTHLNAEKLIGLAVHTLSHNPELMSCSIQSVIGGVIQASIMGFELNTALGHCYLIPRNNKKTGIKEAVFQLGYKGMSDLAYRHPKVVSVTTRAVYEGETFIHEEGLTPVLQHRNIKGTGRLTHAYAIVTLTNGGKIFEVMNREQIESIRMRSEGSSSIYSPWSNKYQSDYAQMAMKTVLRRIFNKGEMPYSIEMKYAAVDDNRIDLGNFMQNQSGEVDLTSLEDASVEVIPNEAAPVIPDPVEEEKPAEDKTKNSLNDDFVKQVKSSLFHQIKEENRKTPEGKAKLIEILTTYRVDNLTRLVELANEEDLQKVLDMIKSVNAEVASKEENK